LELVVDTVVLQWEAEEDVAVVETQVHWQADKQPAEVALEIHKPHCTDTQ
jgi:hypothetical protein